MKKCNKLIALVLSLLMIVSLATASLAAETEEETTTTAASTSIDPSDLTYVEPTYTTQPFEIGDLIDESKKEELSSIGQNISDSIPGISSFIEKIQGFFRILIDFIDELIKTAFTK